MNIDLFLLIIVVITALAFDFTNGFHDTGNAMATSIASGALAPRTAVILSAALNLLGAFLSTAVAATIAKGLIDANLVTLELVFAGLVGGIVWNLLTWLLGIPSSSSHALIGGIVGATIAAVGGRGVIWSGVVSKVIVPRWWPRCWPPWSGRSAPGWFTGSPRPSRRRTPSAGSVAVRSAPRPWSPWRTAPTTRRRRWA
ncbi:phosphate transporter family protein [Mycobacterium ulcerans str. Harvey]|uniref:Phosphate transporter family protein n=1 Tax=Mycobacterium ulcerans str. Harvey TaxID=1299332 RepID=A0ABN0R5Z8_MYCUL|nr:phosphate transporter family protein [Mycobacterium ulcerans str. Harvey]